MAKILIVEDEEDMNKVLVKRITSNGYDVVVATDAIQGTSLAHKEKPDLIVLDLMLPAGGGLAVLENVRSSPPISCIPIVVLTGMKDREYKKKILDRGVEAYLEKPYESDVLIVTIQKILEKEKK